MLKEGSRLTPKWWVSCLNNIKGKQKCFGRDERNHSFVHPGNGYRKSLHRCHGLHRLLDYWLDYALLLAAICMITNFIPYFGPVIGTVPGVIVALIASPLKALEVIIIMVAANYVENHLIAPLVLGKKLRIHPVTIIVVLLTAGSFGGLVGVILEFRLMRF